MSTTQRLLYVDCLRGASMMMVVYSHLLSFSLAGITPSPIGLFFRNVMLPLFFFISGFCAYKEQRAMSFRQLLKYGGVKTKQVLIPTIVMFILFMLYSHNSILEYAFSYDKSGYWFTWVLYQIFLLFAISDFFATKTSNRLLKLLIIGLPIPALAIFSRIIGFHNEAAVLFEWVKVKGFYLFFFAGIVTKCYFTEITTFCKKPIVNTILLVGTVIISILQITNFSQIVCIFTLFYLFYSSEQWFRRSGNRVSSILELLGKNTLAIYFIHFFLLFNIPFLPEWLESLKTDSCFGTHSSGNFVEFIICTSLALIISITSVAIKRIIEKFPLLSSLCFGPEKNNNIPVKKTHIQE